MTIFFILLAVTFAALLVVSLINRIQQQQRMRRLRQRRLRLHAQELQEVVNCLEHTLLNPAIPRLVNDHVVELFQEILALESSNTEHIEAAIRKAEAQSELLSRPTYVPNINYQRDSDAQIAQTQHWLDEAINLLPHLATQGKLNEAELDVYLGDLHWAKLMVSVISYVGQGEKCIKISDRFSAHAFYRKAQQVLMESMHPDPRRMRLIKELSEMIDGSRESLSREFRPRERLPSPAA